MPTDTVIYRGFTKLYNQPVKKLTTPINILPVTSKDKLLRNKHIEISSLWDTGASLTFIKPKIKERLGLQMIKTESSATIAGIGGLVKADYTFISIMLAPNFTIGFCRAYVLDFPVNVDMVIGMDIIGMGDFAVCNTNKETSFSFANPSFPDRIDFIEKAKIINN